MRFAPVSSTDVPARNLLMPYGDVVIVLSTVLRIKRRRRRNRQIIWDMEVRKTLAVERRGGAQTGASASRRPSAFARNVITPMP